MTSKLVAVVTMTNLLRGGAVVSPGTILDVEEEEALHLIERKVASFAADVAQKKPSLAPAPAPAPAKGKL